jgi:hypothetical protein
MFEQQCNPAKFMQFPMVLGCFGKPWEVEAEKGNPLRDEIVDCDEQYGTVGNVQHNGKDMYLDRRVADVSLVYDNGEQLRTYLAIQRMVARLQHESGIFNYYLSRETRGMTRRQRSKMAGLKRRMKAITARIKTLDKQGRKQPAQYLTVKGAFVTFQQSSSRAIALDNYRTSGYWLARLLQPRSLRMRPGLGAYALKVEPAVHPRDVLWPNLGEGCWSLIARRSLANALLLFILGASIAFAVTSSAIHRKMAAYGSDLDQCSRHLPALFYGSYEAVPAVFKLRLVPTETETETDTSESSGGDSGGSGGSDEWANHLRTLLPYASECAGRGGQLYSFDPAPTIAQVEHSIHNTLWHHTPYTIHHTPYPYTIHYTPYTIHYTPYTIHRTPYTIHYTPYTIHHAPYAIHYTPPHPTPYTIHPTPYTIHHAPCTMQHTLYTMHHTPCTIHHTPYTIRHAPYTTHHTPHTVHHTSCTHALYSCTILMHCTHAPY